MLSNSQPTTLFGQDFNVLSLLSVKTTSFFLVAFFILFAFLERHYPKEKLPIHKLRASYKNNVCLFLLNSITLSLFSVSTLLNLAEQYSDKWLFNYLSNPIWQLVLSFLLYDFSLYAWHWASHHFDALWLFHRVHHSDPNLNVTTAFRLHLLDVLVLNLVKVLYIVVFGFDITIVLTNEIINTLFLMFHHTNLSFRGEKFLGYLIIVPCLHRVHHSTERHEQDSNYGAVLSIWDRLFGTLVELEPKAIGINGRAPLDVIGLLKFGFGLKSPKPKQCVNAAALEAMIAEAAYYKAEKRNFSPGHEIHDWLEAKMEIIRQVRDNKTFNVRANTKTDCLERSVLLIASFLGSALKKTPSALSVS
jgi:sterol desaturase/sphingolipid hydroxylase (fatty acid hydroxylase superfamily)